MKLLNLFSTIVFISFFFHIPRLYIESKSRLFKKNNKLHGEDSYQNKRNCGNEKNRLFGWSYFDMSDTEWTKYIENLKFNLINLYRKEFYHLVENISDHDLVSFQSSDKVMSYTADGEVISTWIDNKNKIIRSCFNHEWCSGYFFLQYGSIIYTGKCPNPAKYPNIPFIPEYSLLKLILNKPYIPTGKCFSTDINKNEIKRINYNIDLSKKDIGISSRTYILWNVMTILNSVYSKDYNILIPIPFQKLKNVWNNIGVIFVKWPKEGMTIKDLETVISQNKYHAIGTNLYLRGVTSPSQGKTGRKNVDLVFTSGYIQNPTIIPKYHHATFNGVADYGIYCLTATMGNITSISLTISTNQFEFEKLEKKIDEKYKYSLF